MSKEYDISQLRTILNEHEKVTVQEIYNIIKINNMIGNWYNRKIIRLLSEMMLYDNRIQCKRIQCGNGRPCNEYYLKK